MKLKRHISLLALLVLMIAVQGCTAQDGPTADDSPQTNGEAGPAQESEAEPSASDELFVPVASGTLIIQTTPESGNGQHPVFAWEPVDGAVRYMVFVLNEAGRGYWAWEGAANTVMLGGFDAAPPPSAEGPRLTRPLQWAVIAIDADDSFIASSRLRPVAP